MATPWRRACTGCTKAKRQCTKQIPSCRRCADRGVECEYPPARPPLVTSLPGPPVAVGSSAAHVSDPSDFSGSIGSLLAEDMDFDCTLLDFGSNNSSLGVSEDMNSNEETTQTGSALPEQSEPPPWFLLPLSWRNELTESYTSEELSTSCLETYISTIRNWLYSWVSGLGSSANPLVHPELYRRNMPRCVQDAYTAIATYKHRTPENTETVLHIIEARAEQLIQEQMLRESLGGELSMFEHLARVHALLAYQTIRLFDGDVRSRAKGEDMIHTLFEWCEAMWLSTCKAQEACHRSSANPTTATGSAKDITAPKLPDTELWHSYIYFESVRRAFLTSNILQNVYTLMKSGFSTCPGNVTVSIRRGVWEAKNAYAWEKLVGRGHDDLLLGLETMRLERVIKEVRPVEVDDFGMALMSIHLGESKLEWWFDEKSHGRERNITEHRYDPDEIN